MGGVGGGGGAIYPSHGDEKEVLGHEHPSTLTSMNSLAATYRDLEH